MKWRTGQSAPASACRFLRLLTGGIAVLLFCTQVVALELRNGYVREMPPGQSTTAAFFELVNEDDVEWTLATAQSPVAASVEIHRHVHRDGMMGMRQVDRVVVPAEGRFVFAPGGYHLMLLGMERTLRRGDSVELTLESETGEALTETLPVVSVLDEQRRRDGATDNK